MSRENDRPNNRGDKRRPLRSRRTILGSLCTGLVTGIAGCTTIGFRQHDKDADLSGPSAVWPTKRAGANRRNRVDVSLGADVSPLSLGAGEFARPPVLGPESVFVLSPSWRPNDGKRGSGLFAISKRSQKITWRHSLNNGHTYPTVVGNTVFVQGEELIALDRKSGERHWRVNAPYAWWRTAPLVIDETVVVTDGSRDAFHAIDARTGRSQWTTSVDGDLRGMAADGNVYVATTDGDTSRLVRLDPVNGDVVWRAKGDELAGSGTPVVGSDEVYLHERDQLCAYRTGDGTRMWSRSISPTVYSGTGYALGSDRLFVVGRNPDATLPVDVGRLFALDPADGKILWTGPTVPAVEAGVPTVTSDGVVVPLTGDAPRLGVIDPATGQVRRSISLPSTAITGVTIGNDFAGIVTASSSGDDELVKLSE